jgi:hypothetical protein
LRGVAVADRTWNRRNAQWEKGFKAYRRASS